MKSSLVAFALLAGSAVAVADPGPAKPAPATAQAEIGKPAPQFTLPGLDGKMVRLSALKGKTVVLEWFNPGCPFVKKSHSVGSLLGSYSEKIMKTGVVWLAINSSGPGKQGNKLEDNVEAAKTWSLTHPILRDESGKIGKLYGATNTPHVFVIDPSGKLVYAGAIDNSPDAEGKSAPDGKLVNYVDATLADLAAKRAVQIPSTKAYGCSVKYAD